MMNKKRAELHLRTNMKEQNNIVPIQEILLPSYQDFVQKTMNKVRIPGITTGFDMLNIKTGGFHGGEFIIIAGRPGMGKSSFAIKIAEAAAISNNIPVAIFSLEMSKGMIVNRIFCSHAPVDASKLRMGDFTDEEWQPLGSVADKVALAPLYIDDTAAITVSEICEKCRRLKQTKNLGMIIIDYLQLVQSSIRSDNRQEEISEISYSLKVLAEELDVPVIALSQISRTCELRSDKRPTLSDLRESGATAQDADIVIFLYRDGYYNPDSEDKNILECIIAKHRGGELCILKLGWQ